MAQKNHGWSLQIMELPNKTPKQFANPKLGRILVRRLVSAFLQVFDVTSEAPLPRCGQVSVTVMSIKQVLWKTD